MGSPIIINRRMFLAGSGGCLLALPFLPSLARAQGAGPKRYFISWRICNGHFGFQWLPSPTQLTAANGFSLKETNVREMPLANITGPISSVLDTGFDAYRNEMLLFRHIDHMSFRTDHSPLTGLAGWRDAYGQETWSDMNPGIVQSTLPPSMDQIMASKIYGAVPIPPVNLSLNYTGGGGWSCSYKKAANGEFDGQPGLYPQQAFNLLFGGMGGDANQAARRRGYRSTVIDQVFDHYQVVRDSPQLATDDRQALERYVQEMRDLGERLRNQSTPGCTIPAPAPVYNAVESQVNAAAAAHVDIAFAAIKCGLTQIVNFYFDPDVVMPGINSAGHHSLSHLSDNGSIAGILKCHQWHATYIKLLLSKLAGETDPSNGETYLHNALVLVNNEIGNQAGANGNDPNDVDLNHEGFDMQTAIFGTANGFLRSGYYLDYRSDSTRSRWSRYAGIAYNRLLVSCMLAMGLSPVDWEVGSNPGYGSVRGQVYDTRPSNVVVGDMRLPLPRIRA